MDPMMIILVGFVVAIVLALALIALLTAGITALKMLRHCRTVAQAIEQAKACRVRADGKPYPQTGRGVCNDCRLASDMLYYVDKNYRLCIGCYHRREGLEVPEAIRRAQEQLK